MNTVSPIANLDSPAIAVVDWTKVASNGLQQGAQIATQIQQNRVSKLQAQKLEMELPVVGAELEARAYEAALQNDINKLRNRSEEVNIAVKTMGVEAQLEHASKKAELAEKEDAVRKYDAKTDLMGPSGNRYKVYQELTRLASSPIWEDKKRALIMFRKDLTPDEQMIPEIKELENTAIASVSDMEIEVVDPNTGEMKTMPAVAAHKRGLLVQESNVLGEQEAAIRREREQQRLAVSKQLVGLVPDEQIPQHTEKIIRFGETRKRLVDAVASRGLELQKRLDSLVISKNGVPVIDQTMALKFRDAIFEDGEINDDAIQEILNAEDPETGLSLMDPELKKQAIMLFEIENEQMENMVLDQLEAKFNAQDLAVQLKSARDAEKADVKVSSGHTDFKTFFNRAIGDGKLVTKSAYTTTIHTIDGYISAVDAALEAIDPEQAELRRPYLESREKLIAMRNKIDSDLHPPNWGKNSEAWKAGREIGSDINKKLHHPLSRSKREEWVREIYDQIQTALPSSIPSQVVKDNFSRGFLESVQQRRNYLQSSIAAKTDRLKVISAGTKVSSDPSGIFTK